MKFPLSKVYPRILPGLLAAGMVGCAVQPGNDPVLEAREAELKTTREAVTQLKAELEGFRLDREAMRNDLMKDVQGSSGKEVEAVKAQLSERDKQIEELKKTLANAPAAGSDKADLATVTFTSGRTTTCQVLSYKDGKLTVKLPSGQTTSATLTGIQTIEWPGAAEAGPSSSGNDGGGQSSIADPSSPTPPTPAVALNPVSPAPVVPAPPASPPEAPAGPASKGVSLALAWKNPVPGASSQVKELCALIGDNAEKNFDPAPVPGLRLYGDIAYLAPADQVFKALNARRTPKRMINVSGFPKGSFFYYEISGEFGDGFGTLVLVTDMADQAVAVQLSDGRGGGRGTLFSSSGGNNTYNFVMGRKKANPEWAVQTRVRAEDGLIVIDSELTESYYRLKERNRLILPKPVAGLLLVLGDLY
jgi:hypothetical protein